MESNKSTTETELIRRAAAGDSVAFQELMRGHCGRLLRGAQALCRYRQQAEDLVQETLLEVWRGLERFDGRCQLSTWLYGILRHRYLKWAGRRRLSLPGEVVVEGVVERRQRVSFEGQSADGVLGVQEDAEQLRRAVALLPEEHRQVIELRFQAELSLEEISVSLGIPAGTVKSRLHHGLEKLRQQKFCVNLFSTSVESRARQM
jgi:RNA polymerase sigma-70 factor (ECF subfamily)